MSGMNSHLTSENQTSVLGNFTSFYDKEADKRCKEREENAPIIAQSYYQLVTDFYEYGYGDSFHFAPIYGNMSMTESIQKYEIDIAKMLHAKPGMTIVDIGCGVGGPARTIGKYSGANIIGVNISDYQIQRATTLTAAANLQDTVSFQQADFCNMKQIEDNSIDGLYALESTCHSSDPLNVYKEVYRVLKPGALFVDSAWVMIDKYQPGNPVHEKIKHDIVLGNGLPDMRTKDSVLDKLKEAGMEIIEVKHCEDEGDLPWDVYLVGRGCCSIQSFRTSWFGRTCTHYGLTALEAVKMVPSGTTKVHSVLLTAADGLVASRKTDIFSPMCRILAKKPAN